MAEILKNANSPVYHQIFWKGNVVDSDSLPTVTVYDITEDPESEDPQIGQIVTTLQAEKDETNIGLYAAYIPLQHVSSNATFRLIWEYEVEGETTTYKHDVFVVTPYADLYQASLSIGSSTDPSDPNYRSYKELAAAERYARKRVEEFTGQAFYLYKDVVRIMGSDSDILPLQDRIVALDKLYVNDLLMLDNLTDPVTNNWGYDIQISETGFAIRINRANMLDNTVYVANGMVVPSIHEGEGIFKNGNMYEVQGTFGWKKVPDEVELATIELMKDYFAKDNTWKNQYVQNIQAFDWQVEYNGEVFMGTGNAYADRLLSDFVVNKVAII